MIPEYEFPRLNISGSDDRLARLCCGDNLVRQTRPLLCQVESLVSLAAETVRYQEDNEDDPLLHIQLHPPDPLTPGAVQQGLLLTQETHSHYLHLTQTAGAGGYC